MAHGDILHQPRRGSWRLCSAVAAFLLVGGCGDPLPPPAAPAAPARLTAHLTTVRAVRPESAVGLVPFDRDVLITLPPGPGGRYGGPDAAGWGRFEKSKIGPLLHASDGGSRIAAAVAIRNDLVIYAHADGPSDAGLYAYRSRQDELVPIATAVELKSQLAAGAALDLAEPQLLQAGDAVWLILRIDNQTSLLRLDARLVGAGAPRLGRPFEQVTEKDLPFRIARSDVWFADVEGSLALLRPSTGECWRVGPGGQLLRQPARTTRPEPAAPPLVLPPARAGDPPRVLEFFSGAGLSTDPLGATGELLQYPLLVLHDKDGEKTLERDDLVARLGFPVRGLRITSWCIDGNDVLAYDAMSGEVFRMTLRTDQSQSPR